MTWVLVALGSALILLVIWDIALTLLHPSERGPLSYLVNRVAWRSTRAASIALSRRRLLTFAGPIAMALNVAAWITTLWIGFALIYLPFIDRFSYDEGTPFGDRGIPEALYLSGTAISTVGFGDLVASTEILRLVTVLEGGAGLGAFTAAITYVLAVYPLVTSLRSNALHASDIDMTDPEGAARVAIGARQSEMTSVARDLVESHEHLKRFPILYYFESGSEGESLGIPLQGAAMVCAVLRWGVREEELGYATFYGPALQAAVGRIMDDLERDFIGGRRRMPERDQALSEADAAERLHRLREAVGAVKPEARAPDDATDEGFAEFIAQVDAVLQSLAGEHRHEFTPLLTVRA